jgi:Flp pilus assembly protein TadB
LSITTNSQLKERGRMKTTKALKDMTLAELEKENQKLMAEKEAIREKQRKINDLLSELNRKEDRIGQPTLHQSQAAPD